MRTRNVQIGIVAVVVAVLGFGLGEQVVRAADDNNEPTQKIYANTTRSFVLVSYYLKKSDRPYMNEGESSEVASGTVLQRILNRNAMDVIGILLNDKGEVFTFD